MSMPTYADHPNVSMKTDDRIIHATLTLIGENGLSTVTMSKIADVAGVARQTLYNHYADIDSILAAAIDRHNRESIDLLEAALRVAETPTGRIEQMVRHFVMVGSHAHHAFDFGSGLPADMRVALESHTKAIEANIRDILEDGIQRGDFRPEIDPDIDTTLIRALLDGLFHFAAGAPDRASRIVTTGTRTVLAALR